MSSVGINLWVVNFPKQILVQNIKQWTRQHSSHILKLHALWWCETFHITTGHAEKVSNFFTWKWKYLFSLKLLFFSVNNQPVKCWSGLYSSIKVHCVLKSVTRKAVPTCPCSFLGKLQKWSNSPITSLAIQRKYSVIHKGEQYRQNYFKSPKTGKTSNSLQKIISCCNQYIHTVLFENKTGICRFASITMTGKHKCKIINFTPMYITDSGKAHLLSR